MTIQGETKSLFASSCKVTGFYSGDESRKLLAYNSSTILKVFDQEDGEPVVLTVLDKATDVVVADQKFVVTSSSGECKLYSFSGTGENLLHRSLLPLRAACFNHDGTIVMVGGDEAELVTVNLQDSSVSQIKLAEEINSLNYNTGNDLLAITLSSGDVLIYSMNSSAPNLVKKISKATHSVVIDDDDETDEDNLLATNCEWCPSNTDLLLVASPDKSFVLYNRNDNFERPEEIFKGQHTSKVVDFKFSNNGKFLASLDSRHNLCLWNFKTRKLVKRFEIEFEEDEKNLNNILWNPDNVSLSVSTYGGSLLRYKGIINEDDVEEDSVPFGIDQEAAEGSEHEDDEADEADQEQRKNFAFEDEEDFIIDDDNAGYAEKRLFYDENELADGDKFRPSKRYREGSAEPSAGPQYKLKPFSPGSTPWHSDRRYLTMNSIGYVWAVKQATNYTVTVSFFDRGAHKEYHFKDLHGYDLSSMNEIGVAFATSKFGKKAGKAKIMFRPHENASETWEKDLILQKDEFLTSITASDSSLIVGSSTGLLRIFNLFGVPLNLEKQSPIIACITNNKYFLTITYNERSQSFRYNIQDLDFKYYQRDISLPVTLPDSVIRNSKHHFIKGLFFSDDGDPALVGHDNLVLVLSKWREPLQARWIPILDINDGIHQLGGVGDDLKCWPLGLFKNKLNTIIIRGNATGIYPSFPLALPTEMDLRIPINTRASDEEEDPEEAFMRSKTMGELLSDVIASADADDQYEAEQRLAELQILYDKSLLKIFVSCCNEQNSLKAFNIAQEMKEDKALMASVKIAERMGLSGLVRRINELRENRMELEMAN